MVQEIVTTSWGSRIISALWGILIGIVLIIGSFVLVFWNEGHGLHMAQSLEQTGKVLISVPNAPINQNNNLKVIYFTGLATTNDILSDSLLGIEENAIKLNRKVEMYQWKEKKETSSQSQTGGSQQDTTTYSYEHVWSENLINSDKFKDQNGHQNPSRMAIKSQEQYASKVTVGDFKLPQELIEKMTGDTKVDLSEISLTDMSAKFDKPVVHDMENIYIGDDPQMPKVGDLRISVTKIIPQGVSIIAQQTGDTLQSYKAPAGQEISLLSMGEQSSQAMIADALTQNQILTWVWRLVSLIMMVVGFALLMRPAVVLADVLPFLGSLVGFGTGLVAFVVGIILWAIATAIAWFTVRPLWAIGLIVIVAAICYWVIQRKRKSVAVAKTPPG